MTYGLNNIYTIMPKTWCHELCV